jgi:hypothetical protein
MTSSLGEGTIKIKYLARIDGGRPCQQGEGPAIFERIGVVSAISETLRGTSRPQGINTMPHLFDGPIGALKTLSIRCHFGVGSENLVDFR